MTAFLINWLASAPTNAVPYALAALGLIISERAGVLNLTAEAQHGGEDGNVEEQQRGGKQNNGAHRGQALACQAQLVPQIEQAA